MSGSDCKIEIMQEIVNKLNESQREPFVLPTTLIWNAEMVS
jgi:hypothetical protein